MRIVIVNGDLPLRLGAGGFFILVYWSASAEELLYDSLFKTAKRNLTEDFIDNILTIIRKRL